MVMMKMRTVNLPKNRLAFFGAIEAISNNQIEWDQFLCKCIMYNYNCHNYTS